MVAEKDEKPQESLSANESMPTDEGIATKTIKITDKMTGKHSDVDVFIRNIWTYILDICDEIPPIYEPQLLLPILKKAERILEKEETVLNLEVTVIKFGGPQFLDQKSLKLNQVVKKFL
ncbi:hypothetical protein Tcan_06923 [Toxocara canis]|uniref:Uncharacterized protein n=1 Tax=Toxocara canis TaxID=6265 RepID=A0A0B2UUM1_TOXCA|nr:hypothetical protein Tcan_06923 [Toxocara canis]